MATYSKRNMSLLIVGGLSLLGLLSYTWVHTGNLLASYVSPAVVGFFAAGGIELSIVGLSMRIGELRRSGLSYTFFMFTLCAVVFVSALANISEGFSVKFMEQLTIANIGKLDLIQAIVSTAATGLISLVTLALSEIVGQDVTTVVKAMKRQDRLDHIGEVVEEGSLTHNNLIPSTGFDYKHERELMRQERDLLKVGDTAVPTKKTPRTRKHSGYPAFRDKMASMTEDRPASINQVEKTFNMKHATSARYWKQWRDEQSKENENEQG